MEQLSSFEIAQKRIEQHRQKSNRFKFGIVILILVALATGFEMSLLVCTVPIMVFLGLSLLVDGIEIYVTSTRSELSPEHLEQEMTWLFGAYWQNNTSTQEYMLAQDRIQRRRNRRGQFYLHLCVSLIINTAVLYRLSSPPYPTTLDDLKISFITLLLLSFHFHQAFPSRRRLERRERELGQAIQAEIASSIPESAKHKEKPKRDAQYRIGEDGELEEISEDLADEKPKRTLLD